MIIESNIITDLRIESIQDLYKLKPFVEEGILKVNKSQIGRELGVDRRTVDKYINTDYLSQRLRMYYLTF